MSSSGIGAEARAGPAPRPRRFCPARSWHKRRSRHRRTAARAATSRSLHGDAMQRREIARAEEERVRHAGDAGRLGLGRDRATDAVMPPILTMLGCTKSVAPAAIILRKSLGLVAFSPIASGTPVRLAEPARSDSKSSGGQIGSSTQNGFDGFMAATGFSACVRRPAAVGVDHDRDAGTGGLARGGDRLGGALVQLDVLVAAFERARGVALHVLDVAGILQQRGIGLDALALRRRRAASTPRRLRACRGCPTARCRGRDSACITGPARPSAMQQALDAGQEAGVGRVLADREHA